MVMTDKDTTGQVGVQSTQLSSLIEAALSNALSQRFGAAGGQAQAADAKAVTMGQEPQDDILKAIHKWTLDPDAIPPTEGHLLVMNKDRSFEAITNEEYEQRRATMGQPMAAGIVNTLDGLGGLDIPWGSVLLGALPGAMVSEIVDGLMPPRNADGSINVTNLLIKGGIAWAGVQFGDRLIGRRASQFFAGGLLLFVLGDLLPIDQWVAKITNLFSQGADTGQPQPQLGLGLGADLAQTRSPASTFDPSPGDDALDALRGHRNNRRAA